MCRQGEKLERIRALLTYDGHSGHYQAIPEFVATQLGSIAESYSSEQLPWDEPRFAWIDANLPRNVASITELGSNLGYFGLRLSYERNVNVNGFDPVKPYAEIGNLFASLTGIDGRVRFHGKPVGLADIESLPSADAVICLNVLHHAGNLFDLDQVTAHGSWAAYASEFLSRLSVKYNHLIFQTGNSVKGIAYFPSEHAVPVTADLLGNSGWNVNMIGVLTEFSTIRYQSFELDKLKLIPRVRCQRNVISGLVEYYSNGSLLAELPYGALQRPLFYCRRS